MSWTRFVHLKILILNLAHASCWSIPKGSVIYLKYGQTLLVVYMLRKRSDKRWYKSLFLYATKVEKTPSLLAQCDNVECAFIFLDLHITHSIDCLEILESFYS